jgi:hypothetical protein
MVRIPRCETHQERSNLEPSHRRGWGWTITSLLTNKRPNQSLFLSLASTHSLVPLIVRHPLPFIYSISPFRPTYVLHFPHNPQQWSSSTHTLNKGLSSCLQSSYNWAQSPNKQTVPNYRIIGSLLTSSHYFRHGPATSFNLKWVHSSNSKNVASSAIKEFQTSVMVTDHSCRLNLWNEVGGGTILYTHLKKCLYI